MIEGTKENLKVKVFEFNDPSSECTLCGSSSGIKLKTFEQDFVHPTCAFWSKQYEISDYNTMTWRKIEGAKQQKPEICAITGNQVSTYVQSSENNDVYATPFEAYMTCKG